MKSTLIYIFLIFTTFLHCQSLDIDESFDNITDSINIGNSEDSVITYEFVDVEPFFIDSTLTFQDFLVTNIKYPKSEFINDFDTKIYVEFIIHKDGSVTDFLILKRSLECPDCNKEAIRVLKLTDHKWNPAIKNNESVNYKIRIPVNFKLN